MLPIAAASKCRGNEFRASPGEHYVQPWQCVQLQVIVLPWQASDAAADLEKALAQEHRALGDFMITFHAVVRGTVPNACH